MADLTEIQSSQSVKLAGAGPSSGVETNWALVDAQGNLAVEDALNTAGQNHAQSVTTTAAEALGGATILTGRKILSILPTNGIVYWGYSAGVTAATGTPIFKNQLFTIAATEAVHIYIISAGTVDCRIGEGG